MIHNTTNYLMTACCLLTWSYRLGPKIALCGCTQGHNKQILFVAMSLFHPIGFACLSSMLGCWYHFYEGKTLYYSIQIMTLVEVTHVRTEHNVLHSLPTIPASARADLLK